MSELIFSMAKMDIPFNISEWKFYVDFQREARDKDNFPHGHLFFKSFKVVTVSLDNPRFLNSPRIDVPRFIWRALVKYLTENSTYIHFVWHLFTGQGNYDSELKGLDPGVLKGFKTRFQQENPKFKFD